MPASFNRIDRVADTIQKELAQLIHQELKDPRVNKLITISQVKVTKDLSYAKVYVSVLDDDKTHIKSVVDALNHAASFLRTSLAQRIKLRTIPQLSFIYDDSLVEGQRLSKLIDEAIKQTKDS